jgi:hypothetical protein
MTENSLLDEYNEKIKEINSRKEKIDFTTRKNVIEVNNILNELTQWIKINNVVPPIEVSYWKTTNLNIIKSEVEALKSITDPPEEFQVFAAAREEIAKKHCVKKEDVPVIIKSSLGQDQYQFDTEGQLEFNIEIAKLTMEHKELLDSMEKKDILVNEFLNTDFKRPDYHKLDLTKLGNDISLDCWFSLLQNEGLLDDSKL